MFTTLGLISGLENIGSSSSLNGSSSFVILSP